MRCVGQMRTRCETECEKDPPRCTGKMRHNMNFDPKPPKIPLDQMMSVGISSGSGDGNSS